MGKEVIFITGVDEHGLKIQRTAIERVLNQRNIAMRFQKYFLLIERVEYFI